MEGFWERGLGGLRKVARLFIRYASYFTRSESDKYWIVCLLTSVKREGGDERWYRPWFLDG